MARKTLYVVIWVVAVLLLFCIWAFAETEGEVSLMGNNSSTMFYSKVSNYTHIWDKSLAYEKVLVDGTGNKDKLTIWNDLWLFAESENFKWVFLELESEIDFVNLEDKHTVYIGWAQPISKNWSVEVYTGAYEYKEWSYSIGATNKFRLDFIVFSFYDKVELEYPIASSNKPEIEMLNCIDVGLLNNCKLSYTHEWLYRDFKIENTSRLSLKFKI